MGDNLACNPTLGCRKCYQSFGCPVGLICKIIKYLFYYKAMMKWKFVWDASKMNIAKIVKFAVPKISA